MKPTACGNLILRYEISFAGNFVEYFPLMLSIGINQKINPPTEKEDIHIQNKILHVYYNVLPRSHEPSICLKMEEKKYL